MPRHSAVRRWSQDTRPLSMGNWGLPSVLTATRRPWGTPHPLPLSTARGGGGQAGPPPPGPLTPLPLPCPPPPTPCAPPSPPSCPQYFRPHAVPGERPMALSHAPDNWAPHRLRTTAHRPPPPPIATVQCTGLCRRCTAQTSPHSEQGHIVMPAALCPWCGVRGSPLRPQGTGSTSCHGPCSGTGDVVHTVPPSAPSLPKWQQLYVPCTCPECGWPCERATALVKWVGD